MVTLGPLPASPPCCVHREVSAVHRRLGLAMALVLIGGLLHSPPSAFGGTVGVWGSPITLSAPGRAGVGPQIVSDGTTLTAVWAYANSVDTRIQAAKSTDGGATWSAPVNISSNQTDASGPRLVESSGILTAVWYQNPSANGLIHSAYSTDGGSTWSTPTPVSGAGDFAFGPEIVTDGSTVTVLWILQVGSASRVQAAQSTDGGATWSEPVYVSPNGGFASEIHVVPTGSGITAFWGRRVASDTRVEASSSTDGGATWQTPVSLSAVGGNAGNIDAFVSGSAIAVVWARDDGSSRRVQATSSSDEGRTWGTPVTLSPPGSDAYGPKVLLEGSTITAFWYRTTGADVITQATTSTSLGAAWAAPVTLPTGAGNAVEPSVVLIDSMITAAWKQWDGNNYRVRASTSTDGGRIWTQPVTLSAAGRDAFQPRVFRNGSVALVSWSRDDGSWERLQLTSFRHLDVTRLAGSDRYETALRISSSFGSEVPVVYLATGTNFPDALSAASAAATQGGPLLLTPPTSLPAAVRNELRRLNPALVVVVGGPSVVSRAVETAVTSLLPNAHVRRDSGTDRYETSRVIAENAFPAGTTASAFIATGRNFPDALAASAAAGSRGAPVILVDGAGTEIDADTEQLLRHLGVQQVVIAGGNSAVSVAMENSLKELLGAANVLRRGGADRFATSVEINRGAFATSSTVFLSNGQGFADALAGGALAGGTASALFVVPPRCVPPAVLDQIAQLDVRQVVLLGGQGVLTSGVAALTSC